MEAAAGDAPAPFDLADVRESEDAIGGVADAGDMGIAQASVIRISAASASASQEGYPPQNAVDNDPQTRWSAPGLDSFLQLELTCLSTIEELESLWHKGETRTSRFEVLTSLDGQSWQLALETTASPAQGAVHHALASPVQARWVRLVNHGNDLNDYISLNEIILLGTEDNCEAPEPPPGNARVPLRPYAQPQWRTCRHRRGGAAAGRSLEPIADQAGGDAALDRGGVGDRGGRGSRREGLTVLPQARECELEAGPRSGARRLRVRWLERYGQSELLRPARSEHVRGGARSFCALTPSMR